MPRRPFWHDSIRQQAGRLFAGRRGRAGKAGRNRARGGNRPRIVPKLMARIPRPDMERVATLGEDVPFTRFIPSAITLMALCSGATAIPFAMYGSWKMAVAAIVCAAVLDTLDGWVARLIGAGSEFGAQLDSLADLVSFGIAPSVLVYMWTLTKAGGAGWIFVLLFLVCCAIRLARFNTEATAPNEKPASHFTVSPPPAAPFLIFLPMHFTF